jgi:hypothetical protein
MPAISNIYHTDSGAKADAPAIASPIGAVEPAADASRVAPKGVTLLDGRNAMVVDSRGRSIKVKKLSAFDRMRLFKAVGAEDSENRMFMSYASAAAAVTEIEGSPVAFPMNQIQLSALVSRLDEDGLEAVVNGLVALNPDREDVAVAAQNL